jgi:FKBP-type peptidyl-prolyl cis-trans isomerase FkpA
VKVNYRGTLTDGTEFDSSYKRKEPMQFGVDKVIKCWTEGLQRMKVGGKATLICPSSLAYGDRGAGPIPAGAALTFEIELLEILPPPPAPPATPSAPAISVAPATPVAPSTPVHPAPAATPAPK